MKKWCATAAILGGLIGATYVHAQPEEPAAAATADAVADEPPAEPIVLRARVGSVSFTHHVGFSEDGQAHEHRQFTLDLACTVPPEVSSLSYEVADVTATTDRGARFHPPAEHHGRGFAMAEARELSIQLDLAEAPPADKLRRVEGTVKLRVGAGPVRKAVVGPLSAVAGRTMRIAEYPELTVSVAREDEGLNVTVRGAQREHFQDATFTSADGVPLLSESWVSGWDDGEMQKSYRVGLPDDGRIVLSFWSGVNDATATFTVENVPLPTSAEMPAASSRFTLNQSTGNPATPPRCRRTISR